MTMSMIEDLTSDLNSENEKTRAFAAEDIGCDGLMEGVGPMLARLEIEPSRYVREVIVSSLKMLAGPQLVTLLIPYLRSDDAFIRNSIIDILALQGEESLEALRVPLHDPDKDTRKFVLDVLVQIGSPAANALISEGMTDTDINNVITSVEYLGRLEDGRWIKGINNLFARSDNVLLRCTCLETMALIGDEESVECVNKRYPSYQSISFLEQYSFLKFVARKGSDIHLPLIISLIGEKGQVMHKEIINAIEGILKRKPREYLPAELVEVAANYLESEIKDINKYELLILLGNYRNPEIYTILVKYLEPRNPLVCMGAVEGLGQYGNLAAVPLIEAIKSTAKDEEQREIIERSLARLESLR